LSMGPSNKERGLEEPDEPALQKKDHTPAKDLLHWEEGRKYDPWLKPRAREEKKKKDKSQPRGGNEGYEEIKT